MAEVHYLISDASKKVDVEAHVLRYWEEELELKIPRNEMGHRYYTEFHIRLFRQVKMLKDKGYQLKAIKTALAKSLESDGKVIIPNEVLEEDVLAALKDASPAGGANENETGTEILAESETAVSCAEEPRQGSSVEELVESGQLEQVQRLLNHVIGRAMEENCEKLSQDIAYMVHEKLLKEMDYLMRVADEKEDERFRQLDEMIRACQKDNQCRIEAAATKIPFLRFKKRKFGRNGNKL
jgi:DNA-binding transcriptional MerR regulator